MKVIEKREASGDVSLLADQKLRLDAVKMSSFDLKVKRVSQLTFSKSVRLASQTIGG